MTNILTWRDEWLLGIEELDADHREMMRLMNLLFCHQAPWRGEYPGGGETLALERLDTFIAHMRGHFEREEAFLQSIEYPGFDEHKTEHSLQLAELMDLRRTLEKSGARCLDEEGGEGIRRWFFNHVVATDSDYAEFYFEQLGTPRGA